MGCTKIELRHCLSHTLYPRSYGAYLDITQEINTKRRPYLVSHCAPYNEDRVLCNDQNVCPFLVIHIYLIREQTIIMRTIGTYQQLWKIS